MAENEEVMSKSIYTHTKLFSVIALKQYYYCYFFMLSHTECEIKEKDNYGVFYHPLCPSKAGFLI